MSDFVEPICANCVYSKEIGPFFFECRKHAPVLRVSKKLTPTITNRLWPVVFMEDYCGEWRMDAEKCQEPPSTEIDPELAELLKLGDPKR